MPLYFSTGLDCRFHTTWHPLATTLWWETDFSICFCPVWLMFSQRWFTIMVSKRRGERKLTSFLE